MAHAWKACLPERVSWVRVPSPPPIGKRFCWKFIKVIMLQYFVFLGTAVRIFGASFYIKNVLNGLIKPNRISWLMWAISPLIATAAAVVDGVGLAVLPIFITGLVPLVIFAASFINPKAYWRLGKFDYLCGFLSLLALVLWAITKEPAVAIIFAIASDASATIPTIVKSWRYPETESSIVYITALFNALTTFAAIKSWVFSEYAFAVYMVIANSIILFALYRLKIIKDIPA